MNSSADLGDGAEIDIRELIRKLWNKKGIILGIVLAAALAAGLISFFAPTRYEAVATVGLFPPLDLSNAAGEMPAALAYYSSDLPSTSELAGWASSSELLRSLSQDPNLAAYADGLGFADLSQMLRATAPGADSIELSARAENPDAAAALANAWAAAVATKLSETYGISDADIELVQGQAAAAEQAWNAAGERLVTELAANQSASLGVQLEQQKESLSRYLAAQDNLSLMVSDAVRLQSILQTLPQQAQLPLDLELSLITLQQRAVTGTGIAGTAGPQVQILDPAIFGADYTVAEALAALQQFRASVEAQRSGLDSDVQHIDEAIAATLAASAGEDHKLALLGQDESTAKDRYLALSSQAEEMKKLQDGLRIARVIGQAVPPPRATSHQVLRNLVVAGFLALVLTALAVIAVDWWKQAPLE